MPPEDQEPQGQTQGAERVRIVRLDRGVLRVLLLCMILLVGLHGLVHKHVLAGLMAREDGGGPIWPWLVSGVLLTGFP